MIRYSVQILKVVNKEAQLDDVLQPIITALVDQATKFAHEFGEITIKQAARKQSKQKGKDNANLSNKKGQQR